MLRGEEIGDRVRAIVARLAKQSDASALSHHADVYRELGIVSSGALDLLLSLEDELGVSIPDAEFNEARTIDALSALVRRRREA